MRENGVAHAIPYTSNAARRPIFLPVHDVVCGVPSEEEVDALVGVEFHELSYDFDGENLRVGELGAD
jgi:hypothetical protein